MNVSEKQNHEQGEDAPPQSVSAGIFAQIDHAEQAIAELVQNGFSKESISVICREDHQREHFQKYLVSPPSSKENETSAVKAAGATGLGVGGAVALAELVTTGGISLIVLGSLAGFAILGTFVGVIISLGISKETARFYEQSVQEGDILVAVEIHGDDEEFKQELAKKILADAGSKTVTLPED